jgi:hypothetical protein
VEALEERIVLSSSAARGSAHLVRAQAGVDPIAAAAQVLSTATTAVQQLASLQGTLDTLAGRIVSLPRGARPALVNRVQKL